MQLILNTFMAAWGHARRLIVFVVGGTVLVFGIALLVLPGPAFVVIPMGLGILSLEFVWARIWLRKLRRSAESAIQRARQMGATTPVNPEGETPTIPLHKAGDACESGVGSRESGACPTSSLRKARDA